MTKWQGSGFLGHRISDTMKSCLKTKAEKHHQDHDIRSGPISRWCLNTSGRCFPQPKDDAWVAQPRSHQHSGQGVTSLHDTAPPIGHANGTPCNIRNSTEPGLFPNPEPKFSNTDRWTVKQQTSMGKTPTWGLQLIPGVAQQHKNQALDSFQTLEAFATSLLMITVRTLITKGQIATYRVACNSISNIPVNF